MKMQKPPMSAGVMPDETNFSYKADSSMVIPEFDRECDRLERIFYSASNYKSEWRRRYYLNLCAAGLGIAKAEIRKIYTLWVAEQGGQNNAE